MTIIAFPPTGVSGRFRLLIGKPGHYEFVAAEFDNLITNQGLEALGARPVANDLNNWCHVGTGNATPANANTSLQSWLASTSTKTTQTTSNTSSVPYYSEASTKYRFPVGAATGNISEVGVGWASTNTGLFSRALVLNESGNPTTITVLADEYLDVEYLFRVYPSTSDVTGTISISGSNYNFTSRACMVTDSGYWHAGRWLLGTWNSTSAATFEGSIRTVTQTPAGYGGYFPDSFNDGQSVNAYGNGNFYRDVNFSWGITRGNVTNNLVKSIFFGAGGGGSQVAFQTEFTPAIGKTGTKILTLGYRYSWARRP